MRPLYPMAPMAVLLLGAVAFSSLQGFLAAEERPSQRLPVVAPGEAGLNAKKLEEISPAIDAAIAAGEMPGCVVLIARGGKVGYLQAFGQRTVEPERIAMTPDTLFDLASLTKPIATATSVMLLVDDGKIELDDPVAKHLPKFAEHGKEQVTVLDLLTHQGGLIADNSLRDYTRGADEARRRLLALPLSYPPRERFIYSDVGFLVLGEMVREVSGKPLDEFTRDRLFTPLGMRATGFRPSEELRRRAAPCDQREGRWIMGEVHDPRAHALGGVAGHAGLFSTAEDLAIYAQMLLARGEAEETPILQPATVERFTAPQRVRGGIRTAGWDMQSAFSSNRGANFSNAAFGHGGFTGTSLWIDPERQLTVIFLSNRLHPDGKGAINKLAGKLGAIAAAACE